MMILTSLYLSTKLYAEMNLTAPICRIFFIRLSTKSVGQNKFTLLNQTRKVPPVITSEESTEELEHAMPNLFKTKGYNQQTSFSKKRDRLNHL